MTTRTEPNPSTRGTRLAAKPPNDLVLRLLDGHSSRSEIVLTAGKALAPFVLGKRGSWDVTAPHVADAHVVLAFNGRALFVCAFRHEVASLGGIALDSRWTEAAVPGELRFGSARVSIHRRSDAPPIETSLHLEETRVVDLRPLAASIARRGSTHRSSRSEVTRPAPESPPAAVTAELLRGLAVHDDRSTRSTTRRGA